MDELYGTPTAYPNNLRGTYFDEYDGQDYMNFNFTEHSSEAITGSKSSLIDKRKKTRRLFNKYDLLFGKDAAN